MILEDHFLSKFRLISLIFAGSNVTRMLCWRETGQFTVMVKVGIPHGQSALVTLINPIFFFLS